MSNTLDLNNPPQNHKYSVSVEREETAGERRVRLFKDVVLFSVAIMCFNTLLSDTASAEEKKWAMSILPAAAGGTIGYIVRR